MSTDPNQPPRVPAPPPEEPEADAAAAAPPTVKVPAVNAPAGPPGQEPPTQAMPQWQAPPPPPPAPPKPVPPAPAAPTRWDRPPQPTLADQARPTQWDRPAQPTPSQQPPSPQQPPSQPSAPQQWQQPRPWTEPQPWTEPRDEQRGQWAQPPQPPTDQPRPDQPRPDQPPRLRPRRRKRRVRRSVMALFTVIVLLILLVIADRVALAVTENEMASQFQRSGFPVKPSVSIEGFPFLTQLAAKDFNKVDIAASNVPAGPVTITSVNATIHGLHISSFSSSASARVDQLNATAFVSFGALAAAGGVGGGTGITVTPDGTNVVKISANLGGVFSDSEEAQITTTGPQTISVKVLPGNGALGSVLSSFGSFSFNLPQGVPSSLRITGLTLNSQGLNISASATNATFSQ